MLMHRLNLRSSLKPLASVQQLPGRGRWLENWMVEGLQLKFLVVKCDKNSPNIHLMCHCDICNSLLHKTDNDKTRQDSDNLFWLPISKFHVISKS